MKTLIAFDESKYNSKKQALDQKGMLIETCVAAFNKLSVGDIQPGELGRLFNDTEALVFDKITKGEPLQIGGIHIDKKKAMEIVLKPAGYDDLLNTILSTLNDLASLNMPGYALSKQSIETHFDLSVDGKITIAKKRDENLKEECSAYATNEKATALLKMANVILKSANDLGLTEIFMQEPNGVGAVIDNIISRTKNEILVNARGIERYN